MGILGKIKSAISGKAHSIVEEEKEARRLRGKISAGKRAKAAAPLAREYKSYGLSDAEAQKMAERKQASDGKKKALRKAVDGFSKTLDNIDPSYDPLVIPGSKKATVPKSRAKAKTVYVVKEPTKRTKVPRKTKDTSPMGGFKLP